MYYATLMNKILWDQGVYHVFDKMDENSKHTIIIKGFIVVMQQKFNKSNLKVIKVMIDVAKKEVPQMDKEAINRKKQKKTGQSHC